MAKESQPVRRAGEFESVLTGRRSVRAFRPDQTVSREVVEQAISAAGWAPSPHGRQPWRFAIVESPERRKALADAMSATWQTQLALDGQDQTTIAIRLEKSRRRMLDASLLIIPCLYLDELDRYPDPERQEAERLMAIQSLGAAIQNMLLSLYRNGLDAGWMCAPLFCPEIVRDRLRLPASMIPHAMLPVGYAAREPVRRSRRDVATLVIDWE